MEQNLRVQEKLFKDQIEISVKLGNTHQLIENAQADQNCHRWTAFVVFEDQLLHQNCHKFIEKVHFGMHPTFGQEYVVGTVSPSKPVSISRIGWGYFNIPITIFWTEPTKLQNITIDHMLCFEGTGKARVVKFQMNKTRV